MNDVTLSQVFDKLCKVDEKVDKLDNDLTEHRVSIEHRLTKVEVRSSILGALLGAVTGALSSIFGIKA